MASPDWAISPDGALHAAAPASAPGGESRIEIWQNGALLWAKSYASADGQHGFVLKRAQWTADSQFFVFSMSSSGGHQPWRFPVFVYSRRHRALASLEKLTGAITEADFQLRAQDTVTVSVASKSDPSRQVTTKLPRLFSTKRYLAAEAAMAGGAR